MSSTPTREVARRVFAREFNDASYVFKESDDEMAPNYSLLPTGERANRVFAVGTLTETEDIGSDDEYWRGRVVDPTGSFFVYAGQYQPEAASTLREVETPTHVAVVGKPRTYEDDEGETYVSIRPESVVALGEDEATYETWICETAERTLDRIQAFDAGETGGDPAAAPNEDAAMADEQYDRSVETYRRAVVEALESLETAVNEEPAAADD
ncbi:MAG: DNA-binding protein [Haloarculaceae archaeon]